MPMLLRCVSLPVAWAIGGLPAKSQITIYACALGDESR